MTQTTVSSIVAANRTGSAITFRLSVHVSGAGADDKTVYIL
jgi:P2-related tail formation protein